MRRLQRSLNAALAKDVRVHGSFDGGTAQAVRRYQKRLGHSGTSVVTKRTWQAISRGKLPVPVGAGRKH